MGISDILSIITTCTIVGTFIFGFFNLRSLRKSERDAREHSLKMTDHERRRDYLLSHLSEYVPLVDKHELSFMVFSNEEYMEKNHNAYQNFKQLDKLYYKIIIMLNPDNPCYVDFSEIMRASLSLANKIRYENSSAEYFSDVSRTTRFDMENRAQTYLDNITAGTITEEALLAEMETLNENANSLVQALTSRNEYMEKWSASLSQFDEMKEQLVVGSREYLRREKETVLDAKR